MNRVESPGLRGWMALSVVLLATVLYLPWHVGAIFIEPEIRDVPVARLVANLERQLAKDPRNVELHISLARLHGMAYARKTEDIPVGGFGPNKDEPYYGHQPNLIPYEARPAESAENAKRAETHLAAALGHYVRSLQLEPENLLARLGYAWTLEQSGKKEEAMAEYRRVIAQAWPKEQKVNHAGLGQHFYTEEAAGYLIRLLDQQEDAEEIARLREQRAKLRALPRPITPIAIPLSDGLDIDNVIDRSVRVRFDADGSGLRRRWTWISRDAGWLVYDGNGTGSITSALQWFGTVTFWLFWNDGYEALAALDDDGDGELRGGELDRLAIWHDRNQNGASERGELQPLAAYAIVGVSCRGADGDGVRFAAAAPRGVRFSDGRTRPTYDVILYPASPMLTGRDIPDDRVRGDP